MAGLGMGLSTGSLLSSSMSRVCPGRRWGIALRGTLYARAAGRPASSTRWTRSSAASPLLDKIPLFLKENSLMRVWKFPVPFRREFRCKLLNPRMNKHKNGHGRPHFAKFPVNFPVSREFGAETSSQLTASSGTQSDLCGPSWAFPKTPGRIARAFSGSKFRSGLARSSTGRVG